MYLVLWEYEVRPENEEQFKKEYGDEGRWVSLFRRDENYHGTRLVQDCKRSNVFMTLDFWTSKETYESFKQSHHAEYDSIDRECEKLTVRETSLGTFATV